MKARPPPQAYLIVRRDYPTGYRIPYAVSLTRDKATLLACEKAAEFGQANPTLAFDVSGTRFRFTDANGRQTVFCVETLPLVTEEKKNSEKS